MKKYFALALNGLLFGVFAAALGVYITRIDSDVFNGFTSKGNWYDWFVVFEIPGEVITWAVFDPSDSYLGDDSAYGISIVIFNGLVWLLFVPTAWFYIGLSRSLSLDFKRVRQKWKAGL